VKTLHIILHTMKLRSRIIGSTLALMLAPLAMQAQEAAAKTPLALRMAQMDTAFRALRPQVADAAKNDSSIKLVTRMETNAKAALAFEPAKKAQVAPDSQPAFGEGFQRELKVMVGMLERLNVALKANNNTGAAALVDSMAAQQRSSHMVYRIRPAGRGGRGGFSN
jgi:Cytochrome b562